MSLQQLDISLVQLKGLACEEGPKAAQELSNAYERAILAQIKGKLPAGAALVATGSWARRELCPKSDIDLMILAQNMQEIQVDDMLRSLWDAGFKVDHSVLTLKQLESLLAEGDLPVLTSLLDARLLTGPEELLVSARDILARHLSRKTSLSEVSRRLLEVRDSRRDRFETTIYLLEPNLKLGVGGLRDLEVIRWNLALSKLGGRSHDQTAWLTSRQHDALQEALRYMVQLRFLLRAVSGRATDLLSFEHQEELGPLLFPHAQPRPGVIVSAVAPPVEELMRRYYMAAGEVTRILDAVIEQIRYASRRRPRIKTVDHSLSLFNERLTFRDPDVAIHRPHEVVRIFSVAAEMAVPIHWHTQDLITQTVENGLTLDEDPNAAQVFLDLLVDCRENPGGDLLELMHRTGVLASVLPEWQPCTCRVQHDLYHVFTVDQHQLNAVSMLKQLARAELNDKYPLASRILAERGLPRSLALATLLHDAAKPLGKGHAERGGQLAETVGPRLGLSDEETALVAFLIRQHLTMAQLSQRRDLSDPAVIERFSKLVKDQTHLDLLYVLTVVDSAMTAPDNLTPWKLQLLGQMYLRTSEVFSPVSAPSTYSQFGELVGRDSADDFWQRISETLRLGLSLEELHKIFELLSGATADSPVVQFVEDDAQARAIIIARDRIGLLAELAGGFSAAGVKVLAATAGSYESETGRLAVDTFYLEGLPAQVRRRQKLVSDLTKACGGRLNYSEIDQALVAREHSVLHTPSPSEYIPSVVTISNQESSLASMVEIETLDFVGALYRLCRAMADYDLDIQVAKITTEGQKLVDTFYVTLANGQKIEDQGIIKALRGSLKSVAEQK